MDNNQQDQQTSRKMKIIFGVAATVAVVAVVLVGYVVLSKIKTQNLLSGGGDTSSQEQFEGAPEISSNLQQECQQSAVKLTTLKNLKDIEDEFKAHAVNCREVYFSIDFLSPFRREGMYPDLAVDIAHQAYKTDIAKAKEILEFAKTLKPWEFYMGPVSCDSHHVIDAYMESLELPKEKLCVNLANFKTTVLPQLQSKNFDVLKQMLSNEKTIWLGQPESDLGCPEKISSAIQIISKLTEGTITVDEPKEEPEQDDVVVSIKSKDTEKVGLIFKNENNCLQVESVLVPNLEVSE